MSAIDELLRNNERFAATFKKRDLPARPRTGIAVVTCKDARVLTSRALGLEEGDAHVIRNAGGVITEDVIRSLTVSQRLLGTSEVMVVAHTGCGMMTFRDDDLASQAERDSGRTLPFAFQGFSDLQAHVRESVHRVRSSPFLPHRDQVRGFIYDVQTARLQEVRA